MNADTARSFWDAFTPEQKAEAKRLKSQGLDPMAAIRQVKAAQIGDVAREAQPDLDAAESDPSLFENVAVVAQRAGRTLGMGLDDEARGAIGAFWEPLAATAQGRPMDVEGAYRGQRDEQRERNREIERFAPDATLAGDIAGTLGGAVLPGGKVATAPGILSAVKTGAATGAGLGAAAGFGADTQDADGAYDDSPSTTAANTLTGLLSGGLLGGALGGAGGLAPAVAPLLRSAAPRARDVVGAAAGKLAAAGEALPAPARAGLAIPTSGVSEVAIRGGRALANKLNPLPPTARGQALQRELEMLPDDGPAALTGAVDDIDRGLATRAPTAEVTTPGMESPVPSLEDAAELAGQRIGPAPDNDAALAEVKAMLQARDEGLPFPQGDAARFRKPGAGGALTPDAPMPEQPPTAIGRRSPADDLLAQIDDVDQSLEVPIEGQSEEIPESLRAMMGESAQDWGTRPPGRPQDFTGRPLEPDAVMPPAPPPELVEFFLSKGATREQALAQAHAVMAKRFATEAPELARGRQRAASPFSGQPQAPLKGPAGRQRAARPFND